MTHDAPILEYDPDRKAIIEPQKIVKTRDLPERGLLCFFGDVIQSAAEEMNMEPLKPFKSEAGILPVYRMDYEGRDLAVAQCAVSAPLAAGMLEELIARGGRTFVVCGKAGVLDGAITNGHVLVPTSALRDEGTSYHYRPASREVKPSARVIDALIDVLQEQQCPHIQGRVWTTDGFYRETRGKIARRRQEECIAVDMEAAALFAVAAFRAVDLGMLLCAGDDIGGAEWNPREFSGTTSAREKLFRLALETLARL